MKATAVLDPTASSPRPGLLARLVTRLCVTVGSTRHTFHARGSTRVGVGVQGAWREVRGAEGGEGAEARGWGRGEGCRRETWH